MNTIKYQHWPPKAPAPKPVYRIETLSEFVAAVRTFDTHYAKSDDHRDFERGNAVHREILRWTLENSIAKFVWDSVITAKKEK